jgi:bacillithiol system protein YtxJ
VPTRFVPVPDVDALDDWIPRAGPVLLFLHDPRCPTSRAAYGEVARLGGEVALVDVRRSGAVAAAIAARTGVRHESPQLILLRDGRAAWAASHRAITAGAAARARRPPSPRRRA